MFGGRYAEIDDFLINTFGTLAGYLFFICLQNFRENRKKTVCSLIALAVTLGICFSGIYFVGNHSEELPDGLFAVQDNISEIRIYYKGENQTISLNSDIYNHFAIQVSNCDGHLLEVKSSLDSKVMNDTDCFIEILFDNPQTISFHNAEDFSISNAELEEHKADILAQYQELQKMIVLYFEQFSFQFDMLGNRNLIKTQLQLPVDEFPFLNGGYATSSFTIIVPNRKES